MQPEDTVAAHEVYECLGEELFLLAEKAIFWPSKQILLIADLHLGKVTHFRNRGLAVPEDSAQENWKSLHRLLRKWEPKRLLFLGDLFHSEMNREWKVFLELLECYPQISFELVLGNHDILSEEAYAQSPLILHEEYLLEPPFYFTHEPTESNEGYNLAGHIHPAVRLQGRARQSHRAACFFFGEKGGILPAFGSFTGSASMKPKKTDKIFVVIDQQVFPV